MSTSEPRVPKRYGPLMAQSFALGWLNRAAQAVGSPRFPETLRRATLSVDQAATHARAPGDLAVIAGLSLSLDELRRADSQGRILLGESVSGMNAAEACEFVEVLEQGAPDTGLGEEMKS